jgi:cytochrome d ubiquinol oxidase subunit II
MIAAWYFVISFILIVYVILDGRNFGAGMIHWLVARTPQERRQVVAAIIPLSSWHEVWLISFGGTVLAVFPRLLAVSFSGYYLALFLILWCLILRGMALEVGGHIPDRLWQQFWDFVFVLSSFLLAVLFGAAAGNTARGVPLDASGTFSMAFFTDFNVRGYVGILDWYTVSVALFAVVMLAAHGATYLTLKTDGPVHDRSAAYAKKLWLAVIPFFLLVTVETWFVRPELVADGIANPLSWLGMVIVVAAAGALVSGLRGGNEMRAFLGSNFLIVGMLATGGATLYPIMLYSTIAPQYSLSAQQVASSPGALFLAALWWPVALVLTVGYFIFISRHYYGKVSVHRDDPGFH